MKMQKGAWINFAALVLVNLLWAAQYPAYKIAGSNMESATLNFWTLLLASFLLVPLWLREKQKRKNVVKAFEWKTLREYLLLGILGIVPPSVMLSWGIARSSASNAATILACLWSQAAAVAAADAAKLKYGTSSSRFSS